MPEDLYQGVLPQSPYEDTYRRATVSISQCTGLDFNYCHGRSSRLNEATRRTIGQEESSATGNPSGRYKVSFINLFAEQDKHLSKVNTTTQIVVQVRPKDLYQDGFDGA